MRRSFLRRPVLALPLVLAAALAGFASVATSPYYVMAPGGAYEIAPRLSVPDEFRKDSGRLAFTAVLLHPATWAEAAVARLSSTEELIPFDEVLPRGVSQQEMNRINQQLIDESKLVATVVAMRAAGLQADISGQGVEIIEVMQGMPAEGVLKPGDFIVGLDGNGVQTATELVDAVRRHNVGDKVKLTVIRDGSQVELEAGTRGSPDEPGRPALGALVNTRLFAADLPFKVGIDTGDVGGPSAGLMLSLGVLDAITEGVLTRGYFVAGTGTIAPDGQVGPIGGAREKVAAATQAGANVFLAPEENLKEAESAAHSSLQVRSVHRFQDAIQALCDLKPAPGAPAEPPAPCMRAS